MILVIDDSLARSAHEALRQRKNPVLGMNLISAAQCDAVVADAFLFDRSRLAEIRTLMRRHPAAFLICLSKDGVAPIHEAPDFPALAGRLAFNAMQAPGPVPALVEDSD
jgi:hypothetical protein